MTMATAIDRGGGLKFNRPKKQVWRKQILINLFSRKTEPSAVAYCDEEVALRLGET